MSNDLFKVVGVSRCAGTFKVRFANDMSRVKVLIKTGHDQIELVEMPTALSKADAVTFLKTSNLYTIADCQAAIDAADAKYNGIGIVKARVAKVKTVAKVAPSLEALKARAAKAVDAIEAEVIAASMLENIDPA